MESWNRKGIGFVDKSRIKQEIGAVNLRRPVGFGEQVAAGWPSWLSVVAREAIHGWIPLRAESFEKLERCFRARELATGRMLALKKVWFDNFEPESVRFMSREIMILRKLEGLITSRLSTSVYLVFEYTEHDIVGLSSCSDIKFSESQVKCYMYQLLSGLEHCHSRGIMHRDIQGSNLLVSDNGVLKIADFGMANFVSVGHIQPLTSRVVTLWFRPPELLLGSTSYGKSVDLWSVADVADLGSRGRTEFAGEGSKEVQQKLQASMRGSVVVVATEVQCRERGSGDGSDCRQEYKEKRGFPLQISEIQ
ncbi:protein IMPAIRED IN BABA-INDUCED STERILITY 1-like [Papaver somniferum]|uniref:protein IMPAIRED IN BABA-INDUCED STERILITY 1-like n=1 Tax=Papaver somniferum TaxID=3469 RepID=UPI000E6F508B|nr:protein IMPAIRED IN BABA-INDUCED STERILITY 1-like [Papaver somniferum]